MTWAPPSGPFVGTLTGILTTSGDSLMLGVNGATGPWSLFGAANPSVSVYNNADAGWKLHTNVLAAGAAVDAHYDAARQFNIHWLWAGTNDLYLDGMPPTELYEYLKTYGQARRAAGWKVFAANCLERNSLSSAIVAEWNALIAANWQEYADAPPLDAHTVCGLPGQPDETHTTTAQNAALTAAAETKIRGML